MILVDETPTVANDVKPLRLGALTLKSRYFLSPLAGYTLIVNAEPCSMCASAIVKAAPSLLVYGAPHEPHVDPDLGVAEVFARARRPPRVIAGVLAAGSAEQIASLRGSSPAID